MFVSLGCSYIGFSRISTVVARYFFNGSSNKVATEILHSDRNKTPAQRSINSIRTLSMDAVQKANSGHPGTPVSLAPLAYTIWQKFLNFDPANPIWPNRDRFVLSAGHASMLIYSMIHLAGVKTVGENYSIINEPAVSLDAIKNFRQLDSKTPGHPEYHWTSGVETTTGPLGQGLATSVGMAMAERWLAAYFNRPGFELFKYNVYSICGDGCMMEGVSHEASALAGTWGLGNLIAFWDDNGISIDGHIEGWYTDDTAKRFESYGWHVIPNVDGHDFEAINKAVEAAKHLTFSKI